ncbi:MAG: hypothetical protein H9847_06830, partial [Candidatus Anaerobiospirillum pullicola]|nr:hypothetical protein [Candidatus Anaerobiospirillum pullicola]
RSSTNAIKLVLSVMAFGVTILVLVLVLYPPHSEQIREKIFVVNSCYVPMGQPLERHKVAAVT